jgi:mRNA interferase MazF
VKRGDVVIVEFPYSDGTRGKNRPALVIQNDRDNRRLANTIVAMISGNVAHADEPTQVFVDPKSDGGRLTGLHGPSVVKCCNLFTIRQRDVTKTIGSFSEPLLVEVNRALLAALSLA